MGVCAQWHQLRVRRRERDDLIVVGTDGLDIALQCLIGTAEPHDARRTQLQFRAGKLRTTGNLLDVALSEREFLLVQAAAGSMALSKGGSLHIDGQGRLVTAGGHAVQGLNGEIVAPVTAQDVRIDVGGAVYADNRRVGALQVIKL